MRKYLIGLTAALALVVGMPVYSIGFHSGSDIMGVCKDTYRGESRAHAAKYNACLGYLAGIVDGIETMAGKGHHPKPMCIPSGVKVEHLRQVFLKYMDGHPEKWHLLAASSAVNAFEAAWSCSQ